jgi:hypothetical protein
MSGFLDITPRSNTFKPTVQNSGNSVYYVFNEPGQYNIKITSLTITDVSYLIVGGGGGSKSINGANGGSIKLGTLSNLNTTNSFEFVVGKGGVGSAGNESSIKYNKDNSVITADGGKASEPLSKNDEYGKGGDGCNGELIASVSDTKGSSIKYNIIPGIENYTYKYTAGYGGLGLSSSNFKSGIAGISSAGGGGGPIYVDMNKKQISGFGKDGGGSPNKAATNGGGGCGVANSTNKSTGGDGVIVIQYTNPTPITKAPIKVSEKKCVIAGGCGTLDGFTNINYKEGLAEATSTSTPTSRPTTPFPTILYNTPPTSLLQITQDIQNKNQNKTDEANKNFQKARLIDLNDSYRKRYLEYIKLVMIVVLACFFLWVFNVLNKYEYLPSGIVDLFIIITVSFCVVCIYVVWTNIQTRDLLNYDEIDYAPPDTSMNKKNSSNKTNEPTVNSISPTPRTYNGTPPVSTKGCSNPVCPSGYKYSQQTKMCELDVNLDINKIGSLILGEIQGYL